jgi:hypothetical protein
MCSNWFRTNSIQRCNTILYVFWHLEDVEDDTAILDLSGGFLSGDQLTRFTVMPCGRTDSVTQPFPQSPVLTRKAWLRQKHACGGIALQPTDIDA